MRKKQTAISLTNQETSFADLVKFFRKMRAAEWEKEFTQEDLANRFNTLSPEIKLSSWTVSRIEQGKKRIVSRELVNYLALALDLKPVQKSALFKAAGLAYVVETALDSKGEELGKEQIKSFIEQLPYPAHAITPLWDIVAFNKYIYYLYGYTEQRIHLMQKDIVSFSANLLLILFDDANFNQQHYFGDRHKVKMQLLRNLKAFRELSYRYANTERYKKLQTQMRSFKLFRELDDKIMLDHPTHKEGFQLPVEPSTQIILPNVGEVKFWTLRFPQEYVGGEVIILTHVPASKQYEERLRQFEKAARIPPNMEARWFGIPPLD